MRGLLSLYACMSSVLGAGIPFSLNDVTFVKLAADIWDNTVNHTTVEGNAYMLWASALLLHLIRLYSLSSDAISTFIHTYKQTLQEEGGNTTSCSKHQRSWRPIIQANVTNMRM